MSKYDNEKRGVLFKNTKKKTDKHPDYTGSCEIEGVKYWLSAWVRETKDGEKYFSMVYNVPEEEVYKNDKPALTDDDLPF
jgi:uncharacterized protein (DUF736 family)